MGTFEDLVDAVERIAAALERLALSAPLPHQEHPEPTLIDGHTALLDGKNYRSLDGLRAFAAADSEEWTTALTTSTWHCLVKAVPTNNPENDILVNGSRPLTRAKFNLVQETRDYKEIARAESWWICEEALARFLQVARPGRTSGYGGKTRSLLRAWLT